MIKIIDLPTVLLFMGFSLDQFAVWDDGDGPYIKEWLADEPMPTKKKIESAYKKMMQSKQFEWGSLRQSRDVALKNSDWTQMPDVNLSNKAELATWRQALRDVTSDYPVYEDAAVALKDLIANMPGT